MSMLLTDSASLATTGTMFTESPHQSSLSNQQVPVSADCLDARGYLKRDDYVVRDPGPHRLVLDRAGHELAEGFFRSRRSNVLWLSSDFESNGACRRE